MELGDTDMESNQEGFFFFTYYFTFKKKMWFPQKSREVRLVIIMLQSLSV